MPVVFALISQKGGVGKSTLARAIAAVAAGAGLRVRLIDLDPQQRTLLLWEKARKENEVWPEITVEALAAGDGSVVEATEDILILDLPGQLSEASLQVALRAHLVIQPTGPSLDDMHPGVVVFQALSKCGVPHDRLVFALCRLLNKGEEERARAYLSSAGYAVLPGAIPERAAYRHALDHGRSLTEIDSNGLDELVSALMAGLFKKAEEQAYAVAGERP